MWHAFPAARLFLWVLQIYFRIFRWSPALSCGSSCFPWHHDPEPETAILMTPGDWAIAKPCIFKHLFAGNYNNKENTCDNLLSGNMQCEAMVHPWKRIVACNPNPKVIGVRPATHPMSEGLYNMTVMSVTTINVFRGSNSAGDFLWSICLRKEMHQSFSTCKERRHLMTVLGNQPATQPTACLFSGI